MIENKSQFIESLNQEEFDAGCIKFNIPDEDSIYDIGGEGVWGWVSQEDKAKYDDDSFNGTITSILLNQPFNYFGRLKWGDEVVLQCHGECRPTLLPSWVEENLSVTQKED